TRAMDSPRVQINCLNIGVNKLHVTKNAAKRIHDVARIKIARCDLMQHWRKENEIVVTDQRHFHIRATREAFVEVYCRIKPGKSTTGNDDSGLVHAMTPNGNTTGGITILVMAAIV